MTAPAGACPAATNGRMRKMDASEAKAMTTKALSSGVEIKGLLEHVYGLIRAAATKGKSSIINPLLGLRMPISPAQRLAVYTELRRQGYTVEHHGGDPGDPRERDWDEVSW